MRLLIIEDSVEIGKVLRYFIHSIVGEDIVTVRNASSLAEAREERHTFQPDIVFFDIALPDGNGFELVQEWQELNLPLICMSAYPPEHYLNDILSARVLAFLPKPFDRDDIAQPLREALTMVSQEQQRRRIEEKLLEEYDDAQNLLREKEREIEKLKKETQSNTSTALHLTVRTNGGRHTVAISLEDLMYAEARDNKIAVMRRNGEAVEYTGTLKALEERIGSADFLRCHASYLVNSRAVTAIAGNHLMLDAIAIPVSRKYQARVRERFKARWG
jgi:two-component system LytT family response regulator